MRLVATPHLVHAGNSFLVDVIDEERRTIACSSAAILEEWDGASWRPAFFLNAGTSNSPPLAVRMDKSERWQEAGVARSTPLELLTPPLPPGKYRLKLAVGVQSAEDGSYRRNVLHTDLDIVP